MIQYATAPVPATAMSGAKTMKTQPQVLIVEDEEALTTLLQYNLEKEGYRVSTTADGEEAMMLVDEQQPDLVLLDWMLPQVSGIELCRRFRGRSETRNIPIIITGNCKILGNIIATRLPLSSFNSCCK